MLLKRCHLLPSKAQAMVTPRRELTVLQLTKTHHQMRSSTELDLLNLESKAKTPKEKQRDKSLMTRTPALKTLREDAESFSDSNY